MMIFYFAPGSSSMAVHIALHEVGASFDSRPMSMANRDSHKPEFLAINPEGKVPALVIDGQPLTEVAACLFYLAHIYPDASLLPADDLLAEAQVVSWLSFNAATLHPARNKGLDVSKKIFGLADKRLGKGPWCVGDYSIADIHLFRLYWRYYNGFNQAAELFPNLHAHYEQMMARPAVQKTCEIEAAIGYELP